MRRIGENLGKFIYLMDARLDLKRDTKKGLYNPISTMDNSSCIGALNMFMADCTKAFDILPIVKDADILKNILYSGVWSRYRMAEKEGKL